MTDESPDRSLLPWHQGGWETLQRSRAAGRLPHALLVTGPAGVGKRHLVRLLVDSLLCSRPGAEGLACGDCADCRLLAAGTHPDFIAVGPDPEAKSDEIKVDAIRGLAATDALTAHRGRYKVIVVDPAQQMNLSAANSLLKTLEEPAPDTLLCLVCEQPGRLPATIRSRCQKLMVPVPAEAQALAWLKGRLQTSDARFLLRQAHGAPLLALTLAGDERRKQRDATFAGFAAVGQGARDPIGEAATWSQKEPAIFLDWLRDWLGDILRVASGHVAPRLVNADKEAVLRELARRIRPRDGHRFLQRILKDRAAVQATTLNPQLLYESILVEWARVARS